MRLALLPAVSVVFLVASPAVAGPKPPTLDPLVRVLAVTDDAAVQRDILSGMVEALQGRRRVTEPAAWSTVYGKLAASPDREVREKGLILSVMFDDARALADLRAAIANPKGEPGWRRFALQTLVDKRPADLSAVLTRSLDDSVLRGSALRGLAACDEATTPQVILSRYASLNDAEKADAVATLASRPAYALALLDAMERGTVPRRDLSSFAARQLLAMKNPKLSARLTTVWGTVRAPSKDKTALLARYKDVAAPESLGTADRAHGRQLFAKTCATCHTLFNEGAKIGPDLTGSQRANPEYVLTKLLDPSAAVASDYQVTLVVTKTGRTVSGIIKEETEKLLAVQTANELVRLPKNEVDERTKLKQSMMPEGLLNDRTDTEIRDLLAYLAGSGQVPLPKDAGPSVNSPQRSP
jgi:putative heme-binding domain-containing protein